ncbi:MAG: hypothetical protein JWQ38_3280 [Flavipsychrobacter sp.]|nr:hypothetical protein [Flavipsychrobacter sp.]
MTISLIVAVVIIAALLYSYAKRKKQIQNYQLPVKTRDLLAAHVPFYNDLDSRGKQQFEDRIKDFLATTNVRGVDVAVEDLDRILIAAGAIMLIFSFPDWKYNNISEILLYKDSFSTDFSTDGIDRNVLGMVGDGAMHRQMILSKPSLRASFKNPVDGQNTIIHEFAHLIDKADGAVDGVPEYLLSHPQVRPWIEMVHEQISRMKRGRSDINMYGATNDAEFFAVVAEAFFEQPEKMKSRHPELYALLDEMFHPVK